MTKLLTLFSLFSYLTFMPIVNGSEKQDFTNLLHEWNDKRVIADEYLRKAEQHLLNGSPSKACFNQKLASKFGVEAFDSLIKVKEINTTETDLEGLISTRKNWLDLSNCRVHNENLNFSN